MQLRQTEVWESSNPARPDLEGCSVFFPFRPDTVNKVLTRVAFKSHPLQNKLLHFTENIAPTQTEVPSLMITYHLISISTHFNCFLLKDPERTTSILPIFTLNITQYVTDPIPIIIQTWPSLSGTSVTHQDPSFLHPCSGREKEKVEKAFWP